MKEAVKERVIFENDTLLHNHVKTLVKQGHFLDLLRTSFTDATWQSFMYNLPKGTMKFFLKARRYWLFSCRLIPLFSFPAIFNSGHWGAPTQNPAPMNLFSLQIKQIMGAGFLVGAPQWPELKMAGKLVTSRLKPMTDKLFVLGGCPFRSL